MNIIFDARVIQDHFPGIGRYAYNLLKHLPDHLRENDSITALIDSRARSVNLDVHALQHERITFVDHRVRFFDPRNLLPPTGVSDTKDSLYHFTYYVRPHLVRRPTVTTLYDAISHVYPNLTPSPRTRIIIHLLTTLATSASSAILTISQSAARDIAHYYPAARGKITVTPLAPDERFTPVDQAQQALVRTKYNLPTHFTLYLASNKPHKNLVRLVEAWGMVKRDRRPEVSDDLQSPPHLVIAGHQDPRYNEAQVRVQELGLTDQVRFIGDTPNSDLPALYSACRLFVFPSLYEGFGLPPLEAMACGAPVACSNTSSLPEVVGDAALLFNPLIPAEIAAMCQRVLQNSDLESNMRQSSLKQAAKFTWHQCAGTTVDVYRSVKNR